MLLYKVDTDEGEGDEELTVLQLKEDKLLAGFVPLLAAPQEPCYTDKHTDMVSGLLCQHTVDYMLLFSTFGTHLAQVSTLRLEAHINLHPLFSGYSSRL